MGRRCNYQQLSPSEQKWGELGSVTAAWFVQKKNWTGEVGTGYFCIFKKFLRFDSYKEVLPPFASQRISFLEVDVSQPQSGKQTHQHIHEWIRVYFSLLDAVYNNS